MAQHNNYWSCSRFADWLRGTKKPFVLGWDEWDEWHDDAKKAHPFRYWLADVALNKLQDFVCLPRTIYDKIDTYIHNRFIDRSHLINTGLMPGYYYEFEDKVMYGLFNELVEFVEVELSLHHRAWNDGPRGRRNAEWGIKHLEWEMGLVWDESAGLKPGDPEYGKPTHQAVAALETMRLYKWWKETRPNRVEPHDAVFEEGDSDRMMSNDPDISDKFKRYREIEEKYEREDNAYLVRLILHRRCLWT